LESRRLTRLGGQMQEEISDILRRKLKDPRLGLVSVTTVRVSADLSYASVYFSVIGDKADTERTMTCLGHASNFIRSELGRRLHIKRIPELRFFHDDSAIRGARIESIIKHLKEGGDGEDLPGDS
jgi:ribosome-binding factor A